MECWSDGSRFEVSFSCISTPVLQNSKIDNLNYCVLTQNYLFIDYSTELFLPSLKRSQSWL